MLFAYYLQYNYQVVLRIPLDFFHDTSITLYSSIEYVNEGLKVNRNLDISISETLVHGKLQKLPDSPSSQFLQDKGSPQVSGHPCDDRCISTMKVGYVISTVRCSKRQK